MPKSLLPTLFALICSLTAISQTTQPSCSAAIAGNVAGPLTAITRIGAATPYSLTATIRTEMKLSDGNTISGFTTSRQARDSQGHVRVDQPSVCATDKNHQPQWQGTITVTDYVAKTVTTWQDMLNSPTKTATVIHLPTLTTPTPPTPQQELRMAQSASRFSERDSPKTKRDSYQVEDLGKRNIAGLEASGMRITRTTPSGMQGNSQPLTYVEEKWISDQYGIILLDIKDDPIFGKATYEVTNFTRAEPDASLFQPPADYKIEDRSLPQ